MASKLPQKIFNIRQKLTSFSLRVQKVIQHKVLSKSRNALIISPSTLTSDGFEKKLKDTLKKTWEIYDVKCDFPTSPDQMQKIEESLKGRQYDAIIVAPTANNNDSLRVHYPEINSQEFATSNSFYTGSVMKNLLAYRLANKYLTTSGMLILSNSEADFAGVEDKTGHPKIKQPALKNIQDAQTAYLAVMIGDRDYTDLNSWSVVALSEEWVATDKEDFVVKCYADWADGRNVPMPGSFAYFKMKELDKKSAFVQYL